MLGKKSSITVAGGTFLPRMAPYQTNCTFKCIPLTCIPLAAKCTGWIASRVGHAALQWECREIWCQVSGPRPTFYQCVLVRGHPPTFQAAIADPQVATLSEDCTSGPPIAQSHQDKFHAANFLLRLHILVHLPPCESNYVAFHFTFVSAH